MKNILMILCVAAAFLSCSTHKQADNYNLSPDDVFILNESDIARETWLINNTIKGEWTYSGPSVDVKGKNVLAGLGKPLAKSKLKKKLKEAYKKMGLTKIKPQFAFAPDGTCAIQILGRKVKGTYNYNPDQEKITMKWHGVPVTAKLKRDGKKKLHLTFDADKLLSLISLVSSFSDSSTVKALGTLIDNYDDVLIGFELKK